MHKRFQRGRKHRKGEAPRQKGTVESRKKRQRERQAEGILCKSKLRNSMTITEGQTDPAQ